MKRHTTILITILAFLFLVLTTVADSLGVLSFWGEDSKSLLSFLNANQIHIIYGLPLLGFILLSLQFFLQKSQLRSKIDKHKGKIYSQNEEINKIQTQIGFLKDKIDIHTTKLRITYEKYLDLILSCDAIVIQFSKFIEQFVSTDSLTKIGVADNSDEAEAFIFALTNPIRNKLINFQVITKAAITEAKSAIEESENNSLSVQKLQKELETTENSKDKVIKILDSHKNISEQKISELKTRCSELESINKHQSSIINLFEEKLQRPNSEIENCGEEEASNHIISSLRKKLSEMKYENDVLQSKIIMLKTKNTEMKVNLGRLENIIAKKLDRKDLV